MGNTPSYEEGAKSDEPSFPILLLESIKKWVVWTAIIFNIVVFTVLLCLGHHCIQPENKAPEYFWPSFMLSMVGLPSGFILGISRLAEIFKATQH